MPDNCGGAEADDLSLLLQTPAEVHVIARLAIFRVETAYPLKCPFVEGHVAAGNVLGDEVGKEHMVRTSRRRGDTGLNPIFGRRRDVRAAHARVVAAEQRADHEIEPFRIGHAIAVRIGQDFARRRLCADIAGHAETRIFLPNIDDPGMSRGDFLRVVRRSVVHENHFVVGILDVFERFEASVEGFSAVVGTNDDRNLGIAWQLDLACHRLAFR